MTLKQIQHLMEKTQNHVMVEIHFKDGHKIPAHHLSHLNFGEEMVQIKGGEWLPEENISHYKIFAV